LYDCLDNGIDILNKEDDGSTKTIVAMTDGKINSGSYDKFRSNYNKNGNNIPIYSIMFGDADKDELTTIADLSNAKVFDGRTNLLRAFKEVRGYN
jgi:Ca-activated chloride channel family protein